MTPFEIALLDLEVTLQLSMGERKSIYNLQPLCSAGWSWRLELEWCERKILLGWLELELVAGVV